MNQLQEYIQWKLNEEQFAAAMHSETSSLILAGAWSGKTRVLAYKILYLIYGHKLKPTDILAVTFTNKAAKEMKERLMNWANEIGDLNLSAVETDNNLSPSNDVSLWNEEADSIDDFLTEMASSAPKQHKWFSTELKPHDFKRIGTFHGIFLKILKEDIEKLNPNNSEATPNILWGTGGSTGFSYTKDFTILDPNDTTSVVKEVMKKLWVQDLFKPNECKGFISKQKNQGITYQDFKKGQTDNYDEGMAQVYEEYQKKLEQANSLDFDDLLLLPYLLFKKHGNLLNKRQTKFKYILVDEAQDTNRIQFELIKMLSGKNGNVTLIGDDYQSIYGRRGALMENFLNVKKYWPDIQIFKLQVNYRSRPHIVAAWSHIIKKNTKQYEKTIKAHRTWDDKIMLFSHRDEIDEAANLIDLLKKMKEDKIKSRGEVAILYRTNAQSSPFEQILIQEGIPYKIWWAFKFFERKEIKDVIAYLTHILNPQSNIALKRVLNVPARKIWKTTLTNLDEYAIVNNITLNEVLVWIEKNTCPIKIPWAARTGVLAFMQAIHAVKNNFEKLTPADVISTIVKKINYKAHLIKEEWSEKKGDERYENIWQLINMAGKYEEKGIDALRQLMEEVALLTDISEDEQGDIDAIKLMTVHSSKWLEFPMVFITGLEDNIFPLANAMLEPQLLEEERRLMYVAITRAENHLFLSHANSRMQRWQTKMNPQSRFIGELPEDLLKKYDLWGWSSEQRPENIEIEEWDTVKHKLFGTGYVLETRKNLAIVKCHNPKFGVRKIEMRFLEVI